MQAFRTLVIQSFFAPRTSPWNSTETFVPTKSIRPAVHAYIIERDVTEFLSLLLAREKGSGEKRPIICAQPRVHSCDKGERHGRNNPFPDIPNFPIIQAWSVRTLNTFF